MAISVSKDPSQLGHFSHDLKIMIISYFLGGKIKNTKLVVRDTQMNRQTDGWTNRKTLLPIDLLSQLEIREL